MPMSDKPAAGRDTMIVAATSWIAAAEELFQETVEALGWILTFACNVVAYWFVEWVEELGIRPKPVRRQL
jgi:hypothetical protein